MSLHDDGFALLLPDAQRWRESNIMKIPNANLLKELGGGDRLGGRLWRLPPFSANTWHKHVDSWEFYFLLEGLGRMLRQAFNDTPEESLWLIVAAPQEAQPAPSWNRLASIPRIRNPSPRSSPADHGRRGSE